MQPDLVAYLSRQHKALEEGVVWAAGTMEFLVACYLTGEQPPLAYVTSARCILVRDGEVLLAEDASGYHVIPGGRLKGSEAPEEALHREMLEETGWHIQDAIMIGVMHFHHLTPRPPDHPYPYPDFLQLIYTARASTHVPESIIPDGYSLHAGFVPVARIAKMRLPGYQQIFLTAAFTHIHGASR